MTADDERRLDDDRRATLDSRRGSEAPSTSRTRNSVSDESLPAKHRRCTIDRFRAVRHKLDRTLDDCSVVDSRRHTRFVRNARSIDLIGRETGNRRRIEDKFRDTDDRSRSKDIDPKSVFGNESI
jgi:hypothetical protein